MRMGISYGKDNEDWSRCPFFSFEGMMNPGDRCNHMRENPCRLGSGLKQICRAVGMSYIE